MGLDEIVKAFECRHGREEGKIRFVQKSMGKKRIRNRLSENSENAQNL